MFSSHVDREKNNIFGQKMDNHDFATEDVFTLNVYGVLCTKKNNTDLARGNAPA